MSNPGVLGNVFLVVFLIWPGVTIGAALLNMLITFEFSWSELVIDYLIGLVIGICFYFGTIGDVRWYESLFLTISTGFFGLGRWLGFAFEDASVCNFFFFCAFAPWSAVLVTGALDYGAVALGWKPGETGKKTGNGFLSFLIFCCIWPYALFTSVIGLLIGIIGVAFFRTRRNNPRGQGFGFVGGALWFEWGNNCTHHLTTFGFIVNVFRGEIRDALGHELVHTRQYLYMHDWLGVFYFTIAALWGIISHACLPGPVDWSFAFRARDHGGDVGNPIEVVPSRKYRRVTLTSITISPASVNLGKIGQTQQLTVTGSYSDGSTTNLTNPSSGTTYTSSNTTTATVNANGLVTAAANGTATITATNCGISNSITVTV